jgi:plastocyanin
MLATLIAHVLAANAGEPTGAIHGNVSMPAGARNRTWAWIDGPGPLPAVPAKVDMAQRGIAFDPNVLVIPVGTVVNFPNLGPELHNVHWATPHGNEDLGIYRAGETKERTFTTVGVYEIGCNRHSEMAAVIVVVPNRWVVRVDAKGSFDLTNIEPGEWHVVVWSPHQNTRVERDVVVPAGRTATFTATLD